MHELVSRARMRFAASSASLSSSRCHCVAAVAAVWRWWGLARSYRYNSCWLACTCSVSVFVWLLNYLMLLLVFCVLASLVWQEEISADLAWDAKATRKRFIMQSVLWCVWHGSHAQTCDAGRTQYAHGGICHTKHMRHCECVWNITALPRMQTATTATKSRRGLCRCMYADMLINLPLPLPLPLEMCVLYA